MNIVVLVKQVPDTVGRAQAARRRQHRRPRAVDAVINEMDEYAIEEALKLKEAHGGEVTILTMGPERATETIRKALSMGAGQGGPRRATTRCTARARWRPSKVLAAALGTLDVRPGRSPAPSRPTPGGRVMPRMLAERLGVPQLTGARKVDRSTAAR